MSNRRTRRPARTSPRPAPPGAPPPEAEALTGEQEALLALQQTAGNRAVGALLRRGGDRLPDDTRQAMEARLGADLSDVEVHTSPAVGAQAETLGAHAYTAGTDIGFADGAYAPGTREGDELLAHELAHVVQHKRAGAAADPRRISPAGHPSEQQAQAAARGQPTALDAAPAGVALYAPGKADDEQKKREATTPSVAPAAPTPLDEDLVDDDAEARRANAIAEGIDLSETRARGFLNTDYNDVQDAVRDFYVSAQANIDELPGSPSGYWGLANSLVGFATSAITSKFATMTKLSKAMTITAGLHSANQTYLTSLITDMREAPKTAAKNAMQNVAKAVSYGTESFFDTLRDNLYPALLNLANTDDDAAALLETGSVDAIDRVITMYLEVPDPDTAEMYRVVRERIEEKFAEWVADQTVQGGNRVLASMPNVRAPEHKRKEARMAAQARVADAVAARQGEPPPPSALKTATTALGQWDKHFMTGWEMAFSDPATWEAQQEDNTIYLEFEDEAEPLDEAAETEAQRREQKISRGVALADTRAREFLNTHYNDAQDAVRDFVSSAEEQIDAMPGTPSGHWGLIHTLFGAAMSVLGSRFPPAMVGKIIATQAATAVASGAAAAATTAVDNSRAALKDNARQAMQKFATATGNAQAGVFSKARQGVKPILVELSTTDEEARVLLESATTDGVDALASTGLGIAHPDDSTVYADVRKEMDVPFAAWMQRQIWAEEGLGWLVASFEPNTAPARRQVEKEAAMREPLGETPAGAAAAELEVKFEEDEVVSPLDSAEVPQLETDRLILRRIVDVDTRARGYLNNHHDAVQDAIRDFMAGASLRIEGIGSKAGDYANMAAALVGVVSSLALASFPVLGAVLGAGLAITAQLIAGQVADNTASAKANARRALRSFARETELSLIRGFKQARALLGPLLIMVGFTEDDAREALLLGGQDRYDFVIEEFLGVPNPDRLDLYEEVRKSLEEDFVAWFSAQQGLSEEDTTAAVHAAVAAAEDDAALRRGEKPGKLNDQGKRSR